MHKVQLTFTPQEARVLTMKADLLGYNMTKFIKLLISKEALSMVEEYPVIQLSKKAVRRVEVAHKEYISGKARQISSLDELVNV